MADGSITFSTALDNKQLEKDLRKATQEVESLKRKIEKGGDDKTYLATKLKAAMKAAQDARAEVERLQQGMGAQEGPKELAKHIREAAREAEKLARPLEEKRAERSAIEEQMDRAIAKSQEAIAKIEELEAKRAELRAQGDIRGAGDVRMEESPYRIQLNDQDAKIEELRAKWEAVGAEVEEYEGKIAEANASVANMQGEMEALQAAEANLKQQEGEAASLERKWNAADEKVKEYERDLERSKGRASALAQEASQAAPEWQGAAESIRSRFSAAAEGIRSKMAQAASRSVSPWEQFSRRVSGLLKRVFLFGIILKGLNAIKNAIGSMLMQNDRFSASVANLKATFNGMLSAIVSAVLPALTAFVNMLAGALGRIAGLVDSIFGTNLVAGIQGQRQAEGDAIRQANAQKQAAYDAQVAQEQARYEQELAKAQEKQAKAQEKQAKAAEKNAKAQEKANRQLMAFDEINAMSAASAEEATEAIEDYMEGIEGPDFSSIEAPELENDWTIGDFGDAGVLQGVLDWLDMLKDRILNDVEGPFARIREGLELIKKGWDELVQGFATGDLGLIWQGIVDIIVGSLYVIEGAFGAFMDWLDGLTGGRFHDAFEGLKLTVHGFVEFVEGLLRGDLPLAFQGITDMLDGLSLTAKGVVDAITGFLHQGVDGMFAFLMEKMPQFKGPLSDLQQFAHEIINNISSFLRGQIDGDRQFIAGVLDVVVGIFTLDAERIERGVSEMFEGIKTHLTSVIDFFRRNISNGIGLLRNGVDRLFNFLSDKFPQLRGLFEGLRFFISSILTDIESRVRGVFTGIGTALRGLMDGAEQIVNGAIEVIVGIFTGSGDRIVGGLKGIVNGFITVIEGVLDGAISGVVEFANGIIDGLSRLPGVSIPSITFHGVRLPRLAQGAVIPPNREFMAVLGDQKSGNNIETPEALMRQVVREETGEMIAELIRALGSRPDGGGDVVLVVGHTELARASVRGMRELADTGELTGIVFD